MLGANPVFATPVFIMANGSTPLVTTFSPVAATAKVDLATHGATLFNDSPIAGVVIGSDLYAVRTGDVNIWKFPLDGSASSVFAGLPNKQGQPPMDGPKGTAILSASASMATDGTNLYFLDASQTVREVVFATGQVTTLAGTAGTTDIMDGTGAAAHFAGLGAVTCDGANLYLTDGTVQNLAPLGAVIRKLEIATGKVTTLAGKGDTLGTADGIGAAARFAGASSIATDGHALFMTDPGLQVNDLGDPNGPTIRELELATNRVTHDDRRARTMDVPSGRGCRRGSE